MKINELYHKYNELIEIGKQYVLKHHSDDVYKYNPDGLDKNLTNGEFFNKATRDLVYTKN